MDFATVHADLSARFRDDCFHRDFSIPIFRFRRDNRALFPHFYKLFIVADPKRRTRAKIKYRFRTIRFPLRVFTEKYVQPTIEGERFVLVISEILQA